MKKETKKKLLDAMKWCEKEDKSTEFTIAFMMDAAKVSHECVIRFLTTEGGYGEWKNEEAKP